MKSNEGLRHHVRFAVKWPVTYWNERLWGQGTVLDVSHVCCQLAGTITVAVGMVLKLLVSPPHKEEKLCIEEARVLWVRGYEFGVELRHLPSTDHYWLIGFLERAERRNSFRRGLQHPTKQDLAAMPLALPVKD